MLPALEQQVPHAAIQQVAVNVGVLSLEKLAVEEEGGDGVEYCNLEAICEINILRIARTLAM
jgi:hypothetical protein